MSNLEPVRSRFYENPEKKDNNDEIQPANEKNLHVTQGGEDVSGYTPEMRTKIIEYYGRKAEDDALAPREDVDVILDKILGMSEEEALNIVAEGVQYHRGELLRVDPH